MNLVVDGGARSPGLDLLLAAECSHCDDPVGRLVRHDARGGGAKASPACRSLLMGRSPMWLLVVVVVAARLFGNHA
jgi:hypothetical protein